MAAIYRRAYPSFEPSRELLARVASEIQDALDEGEDGFRRAVQGATYHLDAARIAGAGG